MHYLQLAIFIFILLFSCELKAEVFLRFSSENYSAALRIYELVKEDASAVTDGEVIYSHSRAEIGGSYKGFGLAYLRRMDGVVHHSPDAALIYYYEKSDSSDIEERQYDYQLDVNTLASEGVTLSYQYAFEDRAWIKVNLDIAATDYLYDGRLNGDLNYNEGSLSAAAEVEYIYERDVLFDREVNAPEGSLTALSFSVGINSDITHHELSIKDAYHRVSWKDAPYTRLKANSDRVGSIAPDGKLDIRPLGSGVEGVRDVDQSLDPRFYWLNSWDISSGSLLLDVNYVAKAWWPKVGYAFNVGDQIIALRYSLTDQSVQINYQLSSSFKFVFAVDDLDYKEVHRFDMGFEIVAF
ncbi:MAG: hypothetical protein HRU20_28950 [Pseudomonadales bacterium]|nr:hypothetical protein [Pseudomonadales bacterium]